MRSGFCAVSCCCGPVAENGPCFCFEVGERALSPLETFCDKPKGLAPAVPEEHKDPSNGKTFYYNKVTKKKFCYRGRGFRFRIFAHFSSHTAMARPVHRPLRGNREQHDRGEFFKVPECGPRFSTSKAQFNFIYFGLR